MVKVINLSSREILSSQQACEEWGIDSSTLRKRVHDFPKGTIRKFGTTYAVTRAGMCAVFGRQNQKGGTNERYE
ncbi:helix-turn-helix domain-containing protein [Bacillus sp. CLL-3-40]|nr:helix-turn-helix domain-containing protein [Bacillus changyiensis]